MERTIMGLRSKRFISYFLVAIMFFSIIGLSQFADKANAAVVNVTNGVQFTDTDGNIVHAHGGGMIKVDSYYYWLGENRDGTNLVSIYRSTDMKNWQFRAHLLSKSMGGELATANIERPKLLYNASTNKYVMWMHKENGTNYNEGRVAVASATNIEGPYTYHGSFRPLDWESRDMTVYNDNGTAYLVSSTKGSGTNSDLVIFQLTPDFLNAQTLLKQLWPGQYREAPALFKRNGVFFLLTSGATGWNPNQGKYATSTSISGTWTNPVNFGDSTTYSSQPAFVIPVVGSNTTSYLYLGDRWAGAWGGAVNTSQYVWLPLTFPSNTSVSMNWYNSIDIDTATGIITGSTSASNSIRLLNASTSLYVDGMGRTTNGSAAGQYSSSGSSNQRWIIEQLGSYVKIRNQATGLYLDGMGRTANGSAVGQYSSSTSYNQQWQQVTAGSNVKFMNRATGLYIDGMGRTTNGSDLGQYSNGSSTNQQWMIVN